MTMSQRHRRALEDQRTAWSQFQEIQARRSAAGYIETDEDGEAATRALDEIERQGAIAAEEERAAKLEAALTAPAPDQRSTNPVDEQPSEDQNAETYRSGFDTFLRRGMSACTGEQRSLLERGLVQSDEMRALGASVGTAGGYTVPPGFLARLVEVLKTFGGIFEEAEVLTTAGGNEIQWPTTDDTTEVGAIFGENSQITELDATFGTNSIKAHMYTSRIVRIAIQLLQDSAIDMDAHVAARLGRRIARALAAHLATGTGTNQPQGLVTGLASGVETGTSGKVAYEDLVQLEHSVNSAYRSAAKYLLQDSALRELRKLKDTTGRPLWAPALSASVPASINGRPYAIVDDLPAFAAGAVGSIVYGDIKQAYLVRQVNGAQVMRLTERYADYLQVGFLGFQRFDGRVQNAAAAKTLTIKA